MASTAYSDAVARAKELAARGEEGPPNPGGADDHTVNGGTAGGKRRRKDFSQTIAEATQGIDGEGLKDGAPPGQQKTKVKVGGDVVTKDFQYFVKAEQVDAEHGIVFGWGIICKEDGVDYIDVQNDHIPEDAMLEAVSEFAEGDRIGKEMHAGDAKGQHLFLFPLTTDIAKALGITTKKTGLLLGYKPPADVLAKFKSGELTGFSIGGVRVKDEEGQ